MYYGDYELKTNEDQNDWSDLVELVDALNNTAIGSLQDTLHPLMDANSALAMLAIDNLTVNLDSYIGRCANYYFYHRDLDSRFVFAKWDVNESWGVFNYNMSLSQLKQLSPHWTNNQPGEDRPLAERLWQVSAYDDIYLGHMKRLMAGAAQPDTLLARMEELRDLIRTYVYADTNKMFSNAEFETAMTSNIFEGPRLIPGLGPFIRDRDTWLQSQIGTWTPIEGLVINELMASNDAHYCRRTRRLRRLDRGRQRQCPRRLTSPAWVWSTTWTARGPSPFLLPRSTRVSTSWFGQTRSRNKAAITLLSSSTATVRDVYLIDGAVIVDQVTFPALAADLSFGRYPNGTGDWGFMAPATPGATNGPHNTPPEIAGTGHAPLAPTAAETVWVTSTATDDGTLSGVVLTYDAGSGPVHVTMYDDGAHADGGAGDDVYGGQIPAFPQDTEVDYYVTAADSLGAQTTDPPGAPGDTYTYLVGYAAPPIYINEFMADNDNVIQDGAGDYDDWFELYNGGGTALDLGGMYLTDDLTDPTQWQIPGGVTIPAGGFLLFWADDEEGEGNTHTNFKLGKSGEQIGLYDTDANGNVAIDTLTFGQQSTDVSMGRFPDGAACRRFFMIATPEASNAAPHMPHDAEPDGDVDLDDHAEFPACLTSPGGAAAAGCEVFDAECDGDVDLADFASLQTAFTGS